MTSPPFRGSASSSTRPLSGSRDSAYTGLLIDVLSGAYGVAGGVGAVRHGFAGELGLLLVGALIAGSFSAEHMGCIEPRGEYLLLAADCRAAFDGIVRELDRQTTLGKEGPR
jgi:hypothetical protein